MPTPIKIKKPKIDPEVLYEEKFGGLPDTQEELLSYLTSNFSINMDKVREQAALINAIPWKEMDMIIYAIPKPSARPRYSFETKHFYVPNAAANKKLVKKYLDRNEIIFTRTKYILETYQPTPKSQMSKEEIYLSEMGLIRPVSNPDFDNLAKTYTDMLQGELILNDNIIASGHVEKYYSIKPRIVMKIAYQADFDSNFNRRKITSSTSYKKYILNPLAA